MSTFQDAVRRVITLHSPYAHECTVNMFIAGRWEHGFGLKESHLVNPATEEQLARVYDAAPDQINAAFQAAHDSQPYWHFEVLEQEKERVFRRTAALLEEVRGPLSWIIIQEGGKLWRWAEAEVQETIDTIWHYHGELSRVYGESKRSQMKNKRGLVIREPYGVIFGITPWNFPLAVPSWKIFAALAGGNAIVIKAAEQTPTSISILCYLFYRALQEELGGERAEKLSGIFQVVHGRGETVGKKMLETGNYNKVMFTGGTETGSIIGEIAGRRRKPVSLELGGHAAIILMDDFDLGRAVSEVITGNCGDSGQRCVSTRAVFAAENVMHEFIERYIERMRTLRIGNPADPDTFLGPLINKEQLVRVDDAVRQATSLNDKGVLSHGGFPISHNPFRPLEQFSIAEEAWRQGYYYAPALIYTDNPKNFAMQNEIFGPVLTVMPFSGKDREEALFAAINLMNSSRFGLSNAVLTNQLDLAMKAMERIKSGILYIGRGTTGAEVGNPFGGRDDSGHGREGYGILEVTYEKQVYIDYHGETRMAQAGAEEEVRQLLETSREAGTSIFKSQKRPE